MIKEEKEHLDEIYKYAGKRISEIRNMRGYTRECLAGMTGISVKFLYEIESGRKGFSAGNLYYICNALDVHVDYILFGSENVEYDQQLKEALELFKINQTDSLGAVLKAIYNLMSVK